MPKMFDAESCARCLRLAASLQAWRMLAAFLLAPAPAAAQLLPTDAKLDFGLRVQADHSSFRGVSTRTGNPATVTWLRRLDASARLQLTPQWQVSAGVREAQGKLVLDVAGVRWQPTAGLQLLAGRVDADFGLDNTSSSSWSVGIERSAIWDLAPGLSDVGEGWGLRVDGHGKGWHASAGLYDQSVARAAIGRGVWIQNGTFADVLQVGGSFAYRQGFSDSGRLRSRLGLRGVTEDDAGRRSELASSVAAPARYVGDTVVGLEFAAQQRAWLLQAEAVYRRLQAAAGAPSRSAAGQTVQVAWSPSGQPRRHDQRAARFGQPVGEAMVGGRWEVFYRFDALQARDGAGAHVQTVGASWFLDKHWRTSVNLVSNRSDDPNRSGDRDGQGWVIRLQAVF